MTSKVDKNVQNALKYGSSLIGTKYKYWIEGENMLTGEGPSWVSSESAPQACNVKSSSCNCTGLINLMRRKLGLTIPGLDKQYKYSGGTWIWFTTLRKQHKLEVFDINKIYPKGTLLIRNYKNAHDQGHVAIIFTNNTKNVLLAKLLHCYPNIGYDEAGHKKVGPGVTIDESIGKSHFGWNDRGYYTHACLPKNWLV